MSNEDLFETSDPGLEEDEAELAALACLALYCFNCSTTTCRDQRPGLKRAVRAKGGTRNEPFDEHC